MRHDHQTNCLACLAGEKNQQGVWGFEEHQRGWKYYAKRFEDTTTMFIMPADGERLIEKYLTN